MKRQHLETSKEFSTFSSPRAEALIQNYIKNISIYMRYTVLMQSFKEWNNLKKLRVSDLSLNTFKTKTFKYFQI